jgi:hypothetical protein
MDTERLIRTLAQDIEPVTPIPPPLRRAAAWACVAGIYLLLLVVVVPPRVDPAGRLRDVGFLLEQGAAMLTGITAAFAALAYSIPGYRRSIVWLPMASAFAWVTVVGGRAAQEVPLSVAALQTDWRCVPATLIGAALPAAVLALMLRRGVPLAPRSTAALAGLAAAGVGNIGICFFHPHNSNLAILVWHVGTVLVVTAIAGVTGVKFLRWPTGRRAVASR